jgi:transaldolase
MKLFIDSGNLKEIEALVPLGIIDGITTNPSLLAKEPGDFKENLKKICQMVQGPVSGEVVATDYDGMLREGRDLAGIDEHIVVKVPFGKAGIRACKTLTDEGIRVNVTLCFSAAQALLAAKAGASFISPFVGRIDDNGHDGMALIEDIMAIYRQYPHFKTEVLVASVRHTQHVVRAAKLGAHVATLPPNVLRGLFKHVLTDAGLKSFLDDWAKTGQSIL